MSKVGNLLKHTVLLMTDTNGTRAKQRRRLKFCQRNYQRRSKMNSDDVVEVDEITFGKFLVLSTGHGLTITDIKNLTKAKKIKKIILGKCDFYDEVIFLTLLDGIEAISVSGDVDFGVDLYRVDGIDAVSSFLRLRTESVVATLDWDSEKFEILTNAAAVRKSLIELRDSLNIANDLHEIAIQILLEKNISNNLNQNKKIIENLAETCGATELSDAVATITEIMKDSW